MPIQPALRPGSTFQPNAISMLPTSGNSRISQP